MQDVFMYYTLPQFLSNSFKIFQLLAYIYKQSSWISWILKSQLSFLFYTVSNRIYQEFSMKKDLLIKAEQLNGKMVTFLLYKNIFFFKFISNI